MQQLKRYIDKKNSPKISPLLKEMLDLGGRGQRSKVVMLSMLNAHFQEGLPAKSKQRKKIEHSCELNEPRTTSIRTSYQKTIL